VFFMIVFMFQVLSEQSTTTPTVEKPQPHTSSNVSPIVSALGNTNNVRLGYTAQTMPHAYYQSYVSPLSMLGSENLNVPVCGVLPDPLANQDTSVTYRMRPVGAASTIGPNYPFIWGQNVSTYTTAQTLGQTQTQPTMLAQPQGPQQQAVPTIPRQLPQQVLPQLPLHLFHHQQAMSQLAPIKPQIQQMQPQLLQPLQAQLQQISRDDTLGRQMNPQDNNRMPNLTYNGIQVNDYGSVAPDTTRVCSSSLKTVPAGFCTKTYGGTM